MGRLPWCPLAPAEVRYPTTIGFGFRRGNWSTYFSICGAAVYYPTEGGYCAPRVYDTRYVNRVTYVTNVTNITNINNRGNGSFNRFGLSQEAYAANNNTYLNGGRAFVPVNSRTAAGVTVVAGSEFGGRGVYGSAAKADTSWFTRGRAIGAPVQGKAPIAGPIIVKPTQQATTPTRTFANVPQGGPVRQAQPVFRAPVKAAIVQNSAPITSAGRVLPPAPTEFVKPTTGTKYTGGLNRNDRGLPNGNASNNTGNSGLNGQGSPRIQVQPRGNSGQSNADNRVDVKSPRTGYYSDPRSTGGATKGTTNSADAAAQARASLGIPSRTRSNGNATENGNTGNGTRTTNPTNGSSDGFGNRGRTPRYDGTSGGATNDNSAGKSAPTYTQRPNQPTRTEQPQQTAPIRTEQPRQTQPTRTDPGRTEQPRQTQPTRTEQPRQTQPTRTEPTRTEQPRQTQPTRTEPTRTEPTRTEQPRQTPPARETEKTPPASKGNDSGKDSNSKDSTNRGRGRG